MGIGLLERQCHSLTAKWLVLSGGSRIVEWLLNDLGCPIFPHLKAREPERQEWEDRPLS